VRKPITALDCVLLKDKQHEGEDNLPEIAADRITLSDHEECKGAGRIKTTLTDKLLCV